MHRAMATISAAATRLTVSQKLLIGAVAVVMVMTLFIIQLYTGRPEFVALLPGKTSEEQGAAAAFLRAKNVDFTTSSSGEILVAVGQEDSLRGQMVENKVLAGDNRVLFDNLIEKQSWTMGQAQNAQMEVIAVQNELAKIISNMSGIRSASVILNLPQKRGFGQPRSEPSAAATVFPTRGLSQDTVDTIAHLVASSRGIDPANVRVIDGLSNRQFKASDENGFASSSYLEHVARLEEYKRSQLLEMLSPYIPGVIVTVHAQVDITRRKMTKETVAKEGDGSTSMLVSEQTTEREDRQPAQGGEPGPGSNTGQDISGITLAQNGLSTEARSDSQFQPKFGGTTELIEDPRGNPTKINAVVNIPRSYFVEMWRTQQGGAADKPADPTEADIQPIVAAETARIKSEVESQIDTSAGADTSKGEVQVSMIPVMLAGGGGNSADNASTLGLPLGTGGLDGIVRTVALGGLAVVAVGLVVLTALRATRREALPTAAELVGLPPALDHASDLVGEAGEADSVLQGLELSDDEMKHRKMMEQVSELVTEKPSEAARVLGRWVTGV
jgi:flagellar biosynthesis/type III secretory pathway M-ring protein FliF/YscJ